ncbi:hypothetical protein D3C73_1046560 [compost metagenome]
MINISAIRRMKAPVVLKSMYSGSAMTAKTMPSASSPRISEPAGLLLWRRTDSSRDTVSMPAASMALSAPYWPDESPSVLTAANGNTTFSDTTKKLIQNTMMRIVRIIAFFVT